MEVGRVSPHDVLVRRAFFDFSASSLILDGPLGATHTFVGTAWAFLVAMQFTHTWMVAHRTYYGGGNATVPAQVPEAPVDIGIAVDINLNEQQEPFR